MFCFLIINALINPDKALMVIIRHLKIMPKANFEDDKILLSVISHLIILRNIFYFACSASMMSSQSGDISRRRSMMGGSVLRI